MVEFDSRFQELMVEHLPNIASTQAVEDYLDLKTEGGLDSLGMIGLVVALEEVYEIQIPDESLNGEMFMTPATVWSVVATALSNR